MPTTSEARRCFSSEPMREKPVTDLAGIGKQIGDKLTGAGFDTVILFTFCTYSVG